MATYIMMYTLVATEMAAAWAALRLETMLQDFENPRIASVRIRAWNGCGKGVLEEESRASMTVP